MPQARTDASAMMALFRQAGQGHVFRWWDELSPASRAKLTGQLSCVDLAQVAKLAEDVRSGRFREPLSGEPSLPEYVGLPAAAKERALRDQARTHGEALLRAGKVAALTVAGGQGTRLGFDGPKGTYPIGPISGKTIFHIHAERILATRRRYGAQLPWYIMTSDTTDAATRRYFDEVGFFGLGSDTVRFFVQRMMPALDREFRLVLTARDEVLLSPNGHGGTLLALAETGMLDDMERRGIEEISYFQVDNPIVPAADPVFLGFHSLAKAQMSSKALWKRDPEEPLGAFVRVDGKLVVKEYSDLSKEEMVRTIRGGRLLFGLGSIAIHAMRVDFVREETASGFKLPFHLAEKNSAFLDATGAVVKPSGKNVYKFETFIFDALKDTRSSVVLEVRREEEFSPVKNAAGKDSAESCRRDMSALYAVWLSAAGIEVPPGLPVEISPLFALDAAELGEKRPRDLRMDGPLYLGPEMVRQ